MVLVAYKKHCMEARIMERTSNQPTFLDNLTSDLGGRRTSEFFRKCNQLIPWSELAEPQFSPESIRQVASDLHLKVRIIDPEGGGTPETSSYLGMMRFNSDAIYTALNEK